MNQKCCQLDEINNNNSFGFNNYMFVVLVLFILLAIIYCSIFKY